MLSNANNTIYFHLAYRWCESPLTNSNSNSSNSSSHFHSILTPIATILQDTKLFYSAFAFLLSAPTFTVDEKPSHKPPVNASSQDAPANNERREM